MSGAREPSAAPKGAPTDYPRTPEQLALASSRSRCAVAAWPDVAAAAAAAGVTRDVVVLAGWMVLLGRLVREPELESIVWAAGEPPRHLRMSFTPEMSAAAWVGGVAEAWARAPLLDDGAPAPLCGFATQGASVRAPAELMLWADDAGAAVEGLASLHGARALTAWADAMGTGVASLCRALLAAPATRVGVLPMVGPDAHAELAALGRSAAQPGEPELLPEALARLARERPGALAVVDRLGAYDFGRLAAARDAVAAALSERGVGPGARVVLALPRAFEWLASALGVWRCGAAYVPLEIDQPTARLRGIVDDAQASAVVTTPTLAAELGLSPGAWLDAARAVAASANTSNAGGRVATDAASVAYVIFTSGSTGRPKGVMIEHGSLAAFARDYRGLLGLDERTRSAQLGSAGFDISIAETWPALAAGGCVVFVGDDERGTPERLRDALLRREITTAIVATPLAERLWALEWPAHGSLGTMLAGGSALHHTPPASLPFRSFNAYGPTENTVITSCEQLVLSPGPWRWPGIGRPLPSTRVAVVDDEGQLLPRGAPGELYVSGALVARGYLGDVDGRAFDVDPRDGMRRYATGDVVRWREDGTLEYLGRRDEQVKIRAHRVELGEVRRALAALPDVIEAFVRAETRDGEALLSAYLVSPRPRSAAEYRRSLAATLPPYMVPASVQVLADLPRTNSGKVDAARLPPAVLGTLDDRPRTPPRSALERSLVALWQVVLGVPELGVEDDFFALGGDSLKGMELARRAEVELGRRIELRALYAKSTVRALAAELEPAPTTAPAAGTLTTILASATSAERALIERLKARAAPLRPPPLGWRIARVPRVATAYPAAVQQQEMWYLRQADAAGNSFNMTTRYELAGDVSAAALEEALTAVLARWSVLRTALYADARGELLQRVVPPMPAALRTVDVSGDLALLDRVIEAERQRPFDLGTAPLVRWTLFRVAPRHHVLLQVQHHVTMDGACRERMTRAPLEAYDAVCAGRPPDVGADALEMVDFAASQRAWLATPDAAAQREHFVASLRGALGRRAELAMADTEEPPGAWCERRRSLPAERWRAVQTLARELRITPYAVLLTAYAAVVARATRVSAVAVTTPVANRGWTGARDLMGVLATSRTLVVRVRPELSLRALLGEVGRDVLELISRQELPFSELVGALGASRTDGKNPITGLNFALERDVPPPGLAISGAVVRCTYGGRTLQPKYDLSLTAVVRDEDGPVELQWVAASPAYSAAGLEPLMDEFEAWVRALEWRLDRPVGAPATPPARRVAPPVCAPLTARLADTFARYRDREALVLDGERLTFGELGTRVRALAGALSAYGVESGVAVAIVLPRTVDALVATLAVWWVGAAAVPLDPCTPADRLRDMIGDVGAEVVVTIEPTAATAGRLVVGPRAASEALQRPRATAEDLAYVLYTSGSTGRPKGVAISHGALANELAGVREALGLCEDLPLRWSSTAPLHFDPMLEALGQVAYGTTVVPVPEVVRRDPARLPTWLVEARLDVLDVTPRLLESVVEYAGDAVWSSLPQRLLVGGEALSGALWSRLRDAAGADRWIVDIYGPTETTIASAAGRVRRAWATPRVGVAMREQTVDVVDDGGECLPAGLPGELFIGGAGVGRGYVGAAAQTASRFRPAPWGGRGFLSGDLGVCDADGTFRVGARRDRQAKIRGYRVELGDVEAALLALPGVRAAAVVGESHGALVAYVSGAGLDPRGVREQLRARLPEYMVPGHVEVLDALPENDRGKLDADALRRRPAAQAAVSELSPMDDLERDLAGLWGEVLGRPVSTLDVTFSELGGHSIAALKLLARVRARWGRELTLDTLHTHPTVREFAAALRVDIFQGA